ncbi:MAG: DNA primase [Ruminococcaceae bacterium]|nr:DNA primase [Oscillospiraceae bacterium]
MIDPKIVEEIKARNPIEDVMAQYAVLKRAGSNMVCNCPFHSEKTPSCTVFTARQSFYCFGCGAGGDVISLVRRAEGLEYVEALEYLGRRAGIEVITSDSDAPRFDKRRFYEMNKAAARYFRDILFTDPMGAPGREYAEKRGLDTETIKHFGIGFAPDSFSSLYPYLKDLGYTDEEMNAAFLVGKSTKTGRPFDMFRKRLMFPIIDVSGNVIAFGGRIVDDSDPRKYLNSSDTPVFRKRKNLYALRYAKNSCAEKMILCEGYMDVIALHAAGFENAVATLGTAITPDQARLMAKYTKKVVICYDNDTAGQTAAEKAIRLINETGTETSVLNIKGAKDPDEFIKKFGAPAFSKLIGESKSKFRFTLDSILSKYDLSETDGKVRALGAICKMLAGVYSSAERDIYTREIAEELGVKPESIEADTKKIMRRMERERKNNEREEALRQASGIGDRINPEFVSNIAGANTEEQIIALLLLKQENRDLAKKGADMISAEDFVTEFGKKLFTAIMELENNSSSEFNESELGAVLTVDEMARLEKMKMRRYDLTENGEKEFIDLCAALRAESRKKKTSESSLSADELAKYFSALNKK